MGTTERVRARDLGIMPGMLPTGPANAITDVAGVLVGHTTIRRGAGSLVRGVGPVRTGVTAILPHGDDLFASKVPAAAEVFNGYGKSIGLVQIAELGQLESPILLTNTLSVGKVADALVGWAIERHPAIGVTTSTINPVVAECNDGYLNDIGGRHVGEAETRAALDGARGGAVAEGNVGAGTGMSCYGWAGGIGTASRLVRADGTNLDPRRARPRQLRARGRSADRRGAGRAAAGGGGGDDARARLDHRRPRHRRAARRATVGTPRAAGAARTGAHRLARRARQRRSGARFLGRRPGSRTIRRERRGGR